MMSLSQASWRPPRLETERLVLRGLESSDLEAVFAFAGDPEVARYMSWEQHRSRDDASRFLEEIVSANYARQEHDYAICLKSSGEMIGGCGLYWSSKPSKVMECGYVLRQSAWGQGLMPEAGRRLLRYGFESLGAMRITAPIFAENIRSQRVAEKLGMKCEGTLRSFTLAHGKRWDQKLYAILPGELRA